MCVNELGPGKGAAGMGVAWYRLRADVRVRWRTLVLIAVLVGVGGGVALTAFAGARRTAAAIPQMLAYSRPDDGQVVVGGFSCPPLRVTGPAARSLAPLPAAARVLRLPQVAAYMRMSYLFFSSSRSGFGVGSVNVTASADAQGFRAIDRPLMVAGRFPDPRHPFEAAINDTAAQRLHLSVGSGWPSTPVRCGLARCSLVPSGVVRQASVRRVGLAGATTGPPAHASQQCLADLAGIGRILPASARSVSSRGAMAAASRACALDRPARAAPPARPLGPRGRGHAA